MENNRSGFKVFVGFLFQFIAFASIFTSLATSAQTDQTAQKIDPEKDPFMEKQWHLKKIGVFEAWKTTMGSHDVTIAFVDSGIDFKNADLKSNQSKHPSYDFIHGRTGSEDKSGHGTFIAGIAAAVYGNGVGGAGVCPKCALMSARFLNWEGLGDDEDSIKAIYYAVKHGASVINLSFGGEGHDADLLKALEYAGKKDVFVAMAAANDHLNIDYDSVYPAKFDLPHTMTVAAVDAHDRLSKRSNWGKKHVHIGAPGDDMWGPWFKTWDVGEGTSLATPVIAATAGLIRSIRPELKATQVKKIIMKTARKADPLKGKVATGGVVDVEAAVACAAARSLPCL